MPESYIYTSLKSSIFQKIRNSIDDFFRKITLGLRRILKGEKVRGIFFRLMPSFLLIVVMTIGANYLETGPQQITHDSHQTAFVGFYDALEEQDLIHDYDDDGVVTRKDYEAMSAIIASICLSHDRQVSENDIFGWTTVCGSNSAQIINKNPKINRDEFLRLIENWDFICE